MSYSRQHLPSPLLDALTLNAREAEVLLWAAHGKSNGKIATTLSRSEKTVKQPM